ncbi:coronin-2b [Anaeramoeba flamelloides]|uniref:Coronin-2b n=1 Tax=Anaeramoeba flamelloides TaxID=1746091 RepID=A0AAV8ADD4_9EUKA|nr:coronin-2b [Anaeramoeba flamelloides]
MIQDFNIGFVESPIKLNKRHLKDTILFNNVQIPLQWTGRTITCNNNYFCSISPFKTGIIEIFSLHTSQSHQHKIHEGKILDITFHRLPSNVFATVASDHTFKIWEIINGKLQLIIEVVLDIESFASRIVWNPIKNAILATCTFTQQIMVNNEKKLIHPKLMIWDLSKFFGKADTKTKRISFRAIKELPGGVRIANTPTKAPICDLNFNVSGLLLASGSSDGTVAIWEILETKKEPKTTTTQEQLTIITKLQLKNNFKPVSKIIFCGNRFKFHKERKNCLIISDDNTISIYHFQAPKLKKIKTIVLSKYFNTQEEEKKKKKKKRKKNNQF